MSFRWIQRSNVFEKRLEHITLQRCTYNGQKWVEIKLDVNRKKAFKNAVE